MDQDKTPSVSLMSLWTGKVSAHIDTLQTLATSPLNGETLMLADSLLISIASFTKSMQKLIEDSKGK